MTTSRRAARSIVSGLTAALAALLIGTVAVRAVTGAAPDPIAAEVVLSGTRSVASAARDVTVRNDSAKPVTVRSVRLAGRDASAFELMDAPRAAIILRPREHRTFKVRLNARGVTGPLAAEVVADVDGASRVLTRLYGLSAAGLEGELEPPLQWIVDTLGFRVSVGGSVLRLSTNATPIGDEVPAPLFRRAAPGRVTVRVVARYSPDEPLPFGYYHPGASAVTRVLATVPAGHFQTLHPPVTPPGPVTFDPGDAPFGLFVPATRYSPHVTYQEDARNTGPVRHAMRVFPARDRSGRNVPHRYLVTVEAAANGDYNDTVFVVENVTPVDAAPAVSFVKASRLVWREAAGAPLARFEAQGAAVGSRLYVFGGFDRMVNGQPLATRQSHAFEPGTNRWTRVADLPEAVTHAGVAVDGNSVYLAGGFVGDHPGPQTNHVWKYDTTRDAWTPVVPLPEARGGGALVRAGRNLHFFGGTVRRGDTYVRDAADHWVLNLDAPTAWRAAAPMPNPRNHLAGAALSGKVYAIGGQHLGDEHGGNQTDVWMYDPARDAWMARAPLPRPLGHVSASTVVWDGRIVVVAGLTRDARKVAGVTAYDPDANRWEELPPLPAARQSPVADVVNGRLVVATGSSDAGPMASTWIGER